MLEKDTLLGLCPRDIVDERLFLDIGAVGDRVEKVEEGSDWWSISVCWGEIALNALSLAVFAFAVEEMKLLDFVIILERPCAFLPIVS
jgi:hypothetical protein